MKQLGKIWVFYDAKVKNQSKPLNITQAQALILNLLKQKQSKVYLWTPGWSEWIEMNHFLESDQDYFVVPPSVKNKVDDKTQITNILQTNSLSEKTQLTTSFDEDKTIFIETPIEQKKTTPSSLNKTKNIENTFTKASLDTTAKKEDYGYFFPDFRADQIDLNINKLPKPNFSSKDSSKVFGNDSKNNQFNSKNSGGKSSSSNSIATSTSEPLSSTVSSDRRDKVRFNFKLEVLLVSKNGKTFKSESDNISLSGIKLVDKFPKDFLCLDFSVTIINKLEKDPKKSRIHFDTKFVGDIMDPCRLVFVSPDKKNKELLEKLINGYIKQAKVA